MSKALPSLDELSEAFRTHGVKPERHTALFKRGEDGVCGCAITAVDLVDGFTIPSFDEYGWPLYDESDNAYAYFQKLGYSESTLWGLVFGFDSTQQVEDYECEHRDLNPEEFDTAFDLGRALAARVFSEAAQ